MKTIFLSDAESELRRVYGTDEQVFCKNDLLSRPEDFADTEYIFSSWGMPAFSCDEIRSILPSLKAVFYAAGSVQAFAHPFIECGVKIFSAWAANAVPVAEYNVAQIVLANKGFFKTAPLASAGKRDKALDARGKFCGNYGTKIGIIGVGMIGTLVAKMLKAYKLEVLAFDPFLSDEKAAELGVTKVSLPTLFSECSVVSNHLANNEQTVGMLNGELFALMRPYATFINTGRGAQVVEDDLIAVLSARPDLTAILDVTAPEPPVPDSGFYKLDNCILTPHIAGSSGDEVQRMADYMREEYQSFTQNKPCRFEVTAEMLKTMA
ncbi:MAG: hydroxyacid dehydrogenase [Oscillospiraceae bacterium]|nr:hydroxyacid dehydrogenase [Oscillospiraceae bacterium]